MPNLAFSVTSNDSAVTVTVTGLYGEGSAGNGDAAAIIAAIDSAIQAHPADGLLIDLSGMRYQWGNAIAVIFHLYRVQTHCFRLSASDAVAWNGILTMTWPEWSDQLGKQIQFV